MGFFDLFTIKEEKIFINSLHERFSSHFPDSDEDHLVLLSCISGLLARVAYVDFKIDFKEVKNMQNALTYWMKLNADEAKFVTQIASKEMKALSGLDSRNFCTPLVDLLDIDQRYQILKTLFELAAADGDVDGAECNEISYISKALVLENKYFISARASVKEHLGSLK